MKCDCGCNDCGISAKSPVILNENLSSPRILSEGLKWHIHNKKPLTEHLYRAGSQNYFNLFAEARALYSRGIIDINNQDDLEIIRETHLGEFGMYEGKKVPLDFPMLNEEEKKPIGKPMRDSSGGKAYKVYVKDPKSKNIKTVRFGSGGLKAKINDPKARQAFAKRHKCSQKKDKTKASYWSCRLPRYAKQLGLKSSYSGYW